jgi:hypothetical protein
VTLTRWALTGPLALVLRKKRDDRSVYLSIEGPGFGFVAKVPPKSERQAREFALKLNALSAAESLGRTPLA